MNDITEASALIKNIFSKLNKEFFNNELPELPIYLTATTRAITAFNADVTTVFDRKRKQECQFNFSDDILTDPIVVVCQRMLHVMCHYYCYLHGIPESSRGGTYHNKKFKRVAERHGLVSVKDDTYGWSISCPSERLVRFCADEFKGFSFGVFRYTHYDKDKACVDMSTIETGMENVKNPNSHSIKFQCPICGNSTRATKIIRLICGDCMTPLINMSYKDAEAIE